MSVNRSGWKPSAPTAASCCPTVSCARAGAAPSPSGSRAENTVPVYGVYGYIAPLMHLRRTETGELFDMYLTSFENWWSPVASANPAIIPWVTSTVRRGRA